MKIIENITSKNVSPTRHAALYYKTEPFYTDFSSYKHTNNWEIKRSVEILAQNGFVVDVIDRGNNDWKPKKEYDLFLGLGVGNSGKNFAKYAIESRAKKKVLLALGPQPDISNELVLKRYKMFHERTGVFAPPMRTVTDVIGEKFIEIIDAADFVFSIGEKRNESYKSYERFGKPILNFYPAVSPAVSFNEDWKNTRDKDSYLCFAGNGLICKGVDLLVEAFLRMPEKTLHICGPAEDSFFNVYGNVIKNSKNIKYHGFIEPGGQRFNQLASLCSFVIFHSSSEGCCTSVATSMRAGLVPVINSWTGIIVNDGTGIEMSNDGDVIGTIFDAVQKSSSMKKDEYLCYVHSTLKKASLFTQDSYTSSYQDAINEVMGTFS